MSVEEGVPHQQPCGLAEQIARIGPMLGESVTAECGADGRRECAGGHLTVRQGVEEVREVVDDCVAQSPELIRRDVERVLVQGGAKRQCLLSVGCWVLGVEC